MQHSVYCGAPKGVCTLGAGRAKERSLACWVGRGGCRTQAATSPGEMQRLGIDMKHDGLMQEHAGGWPVCRKPVSPSTIARGLIGCGPGPGHDVGVPGGCYSFRRVDAASNHLPATRPTSPFPQQQNYLLLQSSREVTLHATHLLHPLAHPFFLSTQETSDRCCHSAYPDRRCKSG